MFHHHEASPEPGLRLANEINAALFVMTSKLPDAAHCFARAWSRAKTVTVSIEAIMGGYLFSTLSLKKAL